jgi:hypothetical protein
VTKARNLQGIRLRWEHAASESMVVIYNLAEGGLPRICHTMSAELPLLIAVKR